MSSKEKIETREEMLDRLVGKYGAVFLQAKKFVLTVGFNRRGQLIGFNKTEFDKLVEIIRVAEE